MASQEYIAAAFMTLGCNPSSSEEDVKKAYLELVRIWHPDGFEAESAIKSRATEKMKLLTDAYNRITSMFEERRNLMELEAQKIKPPPQTHYGVSLQEAKEKPTEFSIGYESISVSVARYTTHVQGQPKQEFAFRKSVAKVTHFDGRWLTQEIKSFETVPLRPNESYESASSRSISFRPNTGVRQSGRVNLGSRLTEAQNASDPNYTGEQCKTLGCSVFNFDDGSKYEETTVKTDTWFHDDDKKVKHLQNSNELLDLRGVFRILNKRGEGAACVSVARRIVDLFPQRPENWLMRASCLHRWSTAEAALESLRPAAQRFPKEIDIHIDLARYSAMSGKIIEARQWLVTVFAIAESWGPNSGFNRIRSQIANDPDLIALRDAIPNEPNSWKFKRFFGF